MKKVKILVASVLFCAMGYTGYTAYEKITMSKAERFLQINIEALTNGEAGDDGLCQEPYTIKCMTIYPNGVPVDLPGTFIAR